MNMLKRLTIGNLLAVLFVVTAAYSETGHSWDEATLTLYPKMGNPKFEVHAKLTLVGRPYFEHLDINIGDDKIDVAADLLKQIDWPNLRSMILTSHEIDGKQIFTLSISPHWMATNENMPRYSFEFSEGKLKTLYGYNIGGKKKPREILFQAG